MTLDKQSLQFALHETGRTADVLEAYERLIYDAMSGDHTLFSERGGHREPCGSARSRCSEPAAGPPVPARLVGTERDPPAHRARRVAPPVRTGVARGLIVGYRRARLKWGFCSCSLLRQDPAGVLLRS